MSRWWCRMAKIITNVELTLIGAHVYIVVMSEAADAKLHGWITSKTNGQEWQWSKHRDQQLTESRGEQSSLTDGYVNTFPEITIADNWPLGSRMERQSNNKERKFVTLARHRNARIRPLFLLLLYSQGEVTSHSLWSRYDRHFVGITRHNALS